MGLNHIEAIILNISNMYLQTLSVPNINAYGLKIRASI